MKFLLIAANLLAAPAWAATDFDSWADELAAQHMRSHPEQATVAQYFKGEEQAQLDGRFPLISKAALQAEAERASKALITLHGFDPKSLTADQKVSAGLIAWYLEQTAHLADYADDDFVFNHMNGLQVDLVGFMSQQHPLRNARDVQSYLQRLAAMAAQMDQGIARAQAGQARGALMPRFITTQVIAQFEEFLAPTAAQNVLVTSLSQRMASIEGLDAAAREAARASAEKIVADSVRPAWAKGLALIKEQLPLTTTDAGAWRLPDGAKYYAAALRRNTTTDDTPAEIHAIGLAQVTRIEAEMDGLLKKLGYVEGSIRERYQQLNRDQQPKEADPRPALLARYTRILRDAEKRAKLLFDVTPKAAVEVRREPALTEKSASAHYSVPAPDGSLPGIFWAPLPGPGYGIVSMRTLVYHEAVPGHHFQIALQIEAKNLPYFRRNNVFGVSSAFIEGWALYAEQLVADAGWYEGDPVGRLGQLQGALVRARRLVLDTGLHAMKWTKEQAMAYGAGSGEVDRYLMWPGQACAYMLGRLKIEALRDRAKAALGPKFDLRKFHNLLLLTGDAPLKVMENVVDEWIKTQG